jgi:hypothetical protein
VTGILNRGTLDKFREANCTAPSCFKCEKSRSCQLYTFCEACSDYNRTDIELAVELLEDHGFHVSEAREERATATEAGHIIDERGTRPTGAILLRIISQTAEGK